MNVLTGVDMSWITNKELANLLFGMSECNVLPNTTLRQLKLAAERLAAMPDAGVQVTSRMLFDLANDVLRDKHPGWDQRHVPGIRAAGEYINELNDAVQPQQPAPDVTIKDLRELINHFYDRRPDTSTNLLADEILNKYKVTQKC